jgi:signal transduction protein with GAF and PtsI domain
MTRQQAEQELRDRRATIYDPWIVDQFLGILDTLEEQEAAERKLAHEGPMAPSMSRSELDVISATTAEEREFNELRRDLPRSASLIEATEILFRHLRRVIPAASLALYRPRTDANELVVVAACGVGASAIDGLTVPISERISGWVFAHAQPVLNSDATLELGPVAKTLSVPLRYVAAVPIVDGQPVGVLLVLGSEPFEKDHRRLLENAATLFVSSLSHPLTAEPTQGQTQSQAQGQPAGQAQKGEGPKVRIH